MVKRRSWGIAALAVLALGVTTALPLAASAGAPSASKSTPPVAQNGKIIFRDCIAPGDADIYTMRSDGTEQTPLITGTTEDVDPACSLDDRKIVFRRDLVGANIVVYIANADGTSPVNLTADIAEPARLPTFSPDGKRIAYA